jgi:hypothetical protein
MVGDIRIRESDQGNRSVTVQIIGGLAQLARAPALQAGGHRFDSDILHNGGPTVNKLSGGQF